VQKPKSKYKNIFKRDCPSMPTPSIASGIKCKNAQPIKAPVEKATKIKRILFKSFSFKNKVRTPIKAIKLIAKVETII